ncbi:glycoside hydrolase [Microthyrium microscopicum]|uniref:Glycoside hydrolase n=1 Tax=Microthyrium microscopicum TaxID=703497 RepID=A0A6A6U2X2_9PEZI|nr:glycoside hydrolase [Microthyrium microscopicum]
MPKLHISKGKFYDEHGREVYLRGINVDGSAKLPAKPDLPSHEPTNFFKGDDVSFVNRPFPLDEAPSHFARLRNWGYTTIRWIFTWEALEHAGPGKYDTEFVDYTVKCLRIAKEFGFMVIMDPHQDVWSRFTGGSGAPLWTLYACGLDPERFAVTEAALVQNTWPDPTTFPKMIWATNYYRLASQVMFTVFWAGKEFAPKAIIDGKNISDYLQDHFINACRFLLKGISDAGGLMDEVVVGWETINEPNFGLIGNQDLTKVPSEQKLQKGTSPNAWQATLLGSGIACEVEVWDVGGMGPHKTGTTLVDPQGEKAWLSKDYDDTKYGWKRDPDWKLGECLWAQCGIWDPETGEIIKKDYFAKDPRDGSKIDYLYFTNHWFVDHFRKYRDMVRSFNKDTIIFCQPPTNELPPELKGTIDEDENIVYCPHWYDGLTLMTKKWNSWWNVDVIGVLRGRYSSPVFAIKLGETAIRACFRDQLASMRQEGLDNIGTTPCIFTETGIPFDLDDKKAYDNGDYSSQTSALDAVQFALEGSGIQGYTLWNYTSINTNNWGDAWNGEDLSIYSRSLPPTPSTESTRVETPSSIKATLSPPPSMSASSTTSLPHQGPLTTSSTNYRAAAAHIRPWPRAIHGTLGPFGFDLKHSTFTLSLTATSATPNEYPTEIHLPRLHFPVGQTQVTVSGGRWAVVAETLVGGTQGEEEGGDSSGEVLQVLRWWHAEGEQKLEVKGVVIATKDMEGSGEEEMGYLAQYRQQLRNCSVM